jgi:hypothetical protein
MCGSKSALFLFRRIGGRSRDAIRQGLYSHHILQGRVRACCERFGQTVGMRLSRFGSRRSSQVGIGPEKPLGEGIRELAGRVMTGHKASECLEILPMEFLQILHIEAFAVLAEMGAAT